MKRYAIQLMDHVTGKLIQTAGGKCYVAAAGDAAQVALLDNAGASATNPSSLTRGLIEFYTANTVNSVDLYIMAPGGQFVVSKGIEPSGPNELFVDTGRLDQVAVIPFAIGDTTANTETDTGFDLPTDSFVQPHGVVVDVLTLDSTETIDVGILSTEANGDADGFIALAALTTAVAVLAGVTITTGSNTKFVAASPTLGALLADHQAGTDADQDEGVWAPKAYRCDGTAKSISYTLTAGTDTAEGFIHLPYRLVA